MREHPDEHSGDEADKGDLSGTRDMGEVDQNEAQAAGSEREDSDEELRRAIDVLRALEALDPGAFDLTELLTGRSPSPENEREAQYIDPALCGDGRQYADSSDEHDLLGRSPYPRPATLSPALSVTQLEPRGIGDQPNPSTGTDTATSSGQPSLRRTLSALGLILSRIFHAPQRAVDMLRQVIAAVHRLSQRDMHRRIRRVLLEHHPETSQDLLERFDEEFDPDRREPDADGTLYRALLQLGAEEDRRSSLNLPGPTVAETQGSIARLMADFASAE